jgi:hypothetical protein
MKDVGNFPDIHRHRGSIGGGSGLEAAEKFDPPEDVAHGPGYSQPDPSYHQPKPTHQGGVANMLDPTDEYYPFKTPTRADTEPMSQFKDRYGGQDPFHARKHSPGLRTSTSKDDLGKSSTFQQGVCFALGVCTWNTSSFRLATNQEFARLEPSYQSGRQGQMTRIEAHSTANPHWSDFLNLLDQRWNEMR